MPPSQTSWSVVDDDPVGLSVTDASGRFLEVNKALCEILGRNPRELRAMAYEEVVHPEDRHLEAERLEEVVAGKAEGYALELRYLRPGGGFRWVSIRGSLAGEEKDTVVRRVLDVTERRVEADLRRSEERFRRVFEEGPLGMAVSDPDRRILRVNSAVCELLGYSQEELAGRTISAFTHPHDVALDVNLARRLLAGEIPSYQVEKRYVRKDGEVVSARLWATLIHSDDGGVSRLVMLEDITEVKEAEEARRQLDALKDAFVRVVSHDLQGPLLTIAGLAGLLARAEPATDLEEQRHILGRIAHQADRLQHMVASLLDLDRLYQAGTRAKRRLTDVAELAGRVAEATDLGDRPLTVDVPSLVACIDPDQVERIVENLLTNAAAHTPPGTEVWLRFTAEPQGATLITVDDTGPGVPDHLKAPIFELFRTADPGTRRTGIGLWAVARLAELHGGRAWVEDRPGGGASFRALLEGSSGDPPEG